MQELVSVPMSAHQNYKPQNYDDIDQMKLQFDNILKTFNEKKMKILEQERAEKLRRQHEVSMS